jgi:hypothetical protein
LFRDNLQKSEKNKFSNFINVILKYFKSKQNLHEQHVYFKENFFPFICSTSRSEGINAIFKDNVGPTTSLILFVQEFDRQMKNIDEKGNLRDKNKAHEVALLHLDTILKDKQDTTTTHRFFIDSNRLLKPQECIWWKRLRNTRLILSTNLKSLPRRKLDQENTLSWLIWKKKTISVYVHASKRTGSFAHTY